ncbi:ABC transporter permease [Eubacteriaceae bacterium ES2]|nr:ABC transporter permease [Eubacteriaceae bacterium ES2]
MEQIIEKFKAREKENTGGILKNFRSVKGKKLRFTLMLILAGSLISIALLGDYLAPYDPMLTNYDLALSPPGGQHICGTDALGRDVFSRILSGASNSFTLSFLMVAIVTIVGTVLGTLSGFIGGKFDTVIMRFTDIFLAFPGMVFAIAVAGILGPGLINTVIALALIRWTKYARMTRSLASSIREKSYIEQARFGGASECQIMFKYVMPNLISPIVVMATLDIGMMMMSLAGLSFLGLASQPPMPEWGYMINESRQYMQTAPWLMIYPGLALLIVVVVFNLLGDSLRELLDPKESEE